MKRMAGLALFGLCFTFFWFSTSLSQPDPRDSVIIESKTVAPGVGAPAVRVKVYITNKDSLSNYSLSLLEKSISGGAYMILSSPRTFSGVVTQLITTLPNFQTFGGNRYNSVSPDTFTIGAFWDPTNKSATAEPPNATRKAILEIKFDTVRSNYGSLELDSAFIVSGRSKLSTSFVDSKEKTVRVNFRKGTIIVPEPPPPCERVQFDMNADKNLNLTDLVLLLNCVFQGSGTCNKFYTVSDVIILLNEEFFEPLVPPGC